MSWRSPWRSLQRVRTGVQVAFLLGTLLLGAQFARFFAQALAGGPLSVARPPGVEAFLPVAALVGARRFAGTWQWDDVHPAGLAFLAAVVLGALLARRAFCSWACPIGTLSRGLEWARTRLLRLPARWNAPRWLRTLALAPRYLLLAAFLFLIGGMSAQQAGAFLYSPYNLAADANMLAMFLHLSAAGFAVLALLVALSVAIRNGFCRFVCPYGALLGVAGAASPFRIVRDPAACNACGACTRACGQGIRVAEAKTVHSLDCSACLACVSACNVQGALDVRLLGQNGGKAVRPWLVPACALAVLLVAWSGAIATGHWRSALSDQEFAEAYRTGLRER
jgi:polyferredoxin